MSSSSQERLPQLDLHSNLLTLAHTLTLVTHGLPEVVEHQQLLDGGVDSTDVTQPVVQPAAPDVELGRAQHSLTQVLHSQQQPSLGLQSNKPSPLGNDNIIQLYTFCLR